MCVRLFPLHATMGSQGASSSGSTASASSSSGKAAPKPLHDCACFFIFLTHTVLERMTHMPFPLGAVVKFVETTVGRWTHPLTRSLECHGLCILANIDDKICAMGTFSEGCIVCTASQLRTALSLLWTQGFVGTSAGLWLKYEGVVKEDIEKAVYIANRIPLVNLVTPVVCAVSSPLARALSNWLLKHGARLDKATQTIDGNLVILEQEMEIRSFNNDLGPYSCKDVGPVIANDICSGGKVMNVDEFVKDIGGDEKDLLERNVRLSEKGVSVEDVTSRERHKLSPNVILEDDLLSAGASLQDANADKGAAMAVPTITETPCLATQGKDDYLPDVLEMIESSWLLGKFQSLSTGVRPPQETKTSAKPHNYGMKIKIKTLFSG